MNSSISPRRQIIGKRKLNFYSFFFQKEKNIIKNSLIVVKVLLDCKILRFWKFNYEMLWVLQFTFKNAFNSSNSIFLAFRRKWIFVKWEDLINYYFFTCTWSTLTTKVTLNLNISMTSTSLQSYLLTCLNIFITSFSSSPSPS